MHAIPADFFISVAHKDELYDCLPPWPFGPGNKEGLKFGGSPAGDEWLSSLLLPKMVTYSRRV